MNLDFALILVVLTFLTGLIWALDSLMFRQRRMNREARAGNPPGHEPVVVEYSRSLFPVLLVVLLLCAIRQRKRNVALGSSVHKMTELQTVRLCSQW